MNSFERPIKKTLERLLKNLKESLKTSDNSPADLPSHVDFCPGDPWFWMSLSPADETDSRPGPDSHGLGPASVNNPGRFYNREEYTVFSILGMTFY